MKNIWVIFKREFRGYFDTPVAYVFMVIFLVISGIFTFYAGQFFERGQATLNAFFQYHPWLYMIFIPAISMRLWAEERKQGTIEILLTLPVTTSEAVIGKFLAAWFFCSLSLGLTFPLWITVNYLGSPDNGVIFVSYVGSIIMAGGYLAIGSSLSSMTKNQVIAFIVSFLTCLIFNLIGTQVMTSTVSNLLPVNLVDAISTLSFITQFETLTKGVLDIRCVVYFLSLISFWLYVNTVVIEMNKVD